MNILRYAEVARKVGVSKMTTYRWATKPEHADMKFPKPFDLGVNSVGFAEEEIDAWLEARAAARDDVEASVAARAHERDDIDADGNDAEGEDDDGDDADAEAA